MVTINKKKGMAGDSNEPYIFLSYSHHSIDDVAPLISKLTSDGFRIWCDVGIRGGTEWKEEIATHIEDCEVFIALISNAYLDSKECTKELSFAETKRKKCLLVYLEKVEKIPKWIEMDFHRYQYLYKYLNESTFYNDFINVEEVKLCKGRSALAKEASRIEGLIGIDYENTRIWNTRSNLEEENEKIDKILTIYYEGKMYQDTKRYEKARLKYQEALEKYILESIERGTNDYDDKMMAEIIASIADMFRNLGDRTGAEQFYIESLELWFKLGRKYSYIWVENVAKIFEALGDLSRESGDKENFKKGEEKYKGALELYQVLNNIYPNKFLFEIDRIEESLKVLHMLIEPKKIRS